MLGLEVFRLIEEIWMHPPALYYPFIHVRDEDWLKTAALYWPAIHRLVPRGHQIHDTATAHEFVEAGVLLAEDPDLYVHETQSSFTSALRRNIDQLESRFHIGDIPYSGYVEKLGWIHVQKIPPMLLDMFVARRLAVRGRPDMGLRTLRSHSPGSEWVGFHPAVAGAYMTALAGHVSEQGRFQPLTDAQDLRRAVPDPDAEAALRLLTGAPGPEPELAEEYILLALETVLPTNLAGVHAESILRCREKLQGELDAFRAYVDDQVEELRQIAAVPAEHRRLEEFSRHVQGTIERPLRELEQGLRLHKLETVRSLLTTSAYAPPAAAGAGLAYLAEPTATVAGSVAAVIGKAWWDVRQERSTIRKDSPVGYLLDVRQRLTPATASRRFKRFFRRDR
ncbi:DUF6236 family protein [Promicromonospora sp. NPDC090134]|uniref:DUF6236 family protein n=1 Tax=Promicromonospora sp. NPDC090134 TaxID=3364408 RepID=UPI003805703F